MEAIFISLISIVIINTCSARTTYSSGSSSGSSLSTGAIIGIAVGGGVFVIVLVVGTILLVICAIKRTNRQRMNTIPLAAQMALAQEENQYKPPGFNQASAPNQPPSYNQMPSYGQQPTKMTPVS